MILCNLIYPENYRLGGITMKVLVIPLVVLLAIAFVVTGCSTASTPPPTTSAPPTTQAPTTPVNTQPAATTPASTTTSATTPAATSTTPASTNSPQYGGTLIVAEAAGPAGPFGTPWENALSPITTQMLSLESLLAEQHDGTLKPLLATSYDINADPSNPSLTFHLRQGVKFTDGTDFNAQAVQWNLQQWVKSGMAGSTTAFWKSIDVVDNNTVRINLTAWRNYLPNAFGDAAFFMVSPTAYQKNGETYSQTHMVGTGPFIETSFQRDVSMTLTKNPNYWMAGKPYLDGIKQLYVVDDQTRESLMKSGGAQMMNDNNNNLVASELQSAGYTTLPQPDAGYFSLVPDSANADSPWSKLDVRLAAAYAIDNTALAKTFGYGFDTPADQYYPPGSPAYDSSLQPREYNPTKAKQLLAEAGYPNGFKTNLVVAVDASRDMAVAMQAELKAVGIDATLQYPQFGAWIQQVTGTWQNGVQFMSQSLWPNPNADWNLFMGEPKAWLKSVQHPEGWQDMLYASFATPTPDPTLLKKLQDAMYNDETTIPVIWHNGTYTTTTNVHDTGYGTRGLWNFWNPQNAWMSK